MSTKSLAWQACLGVLVCWRLADKAGTLLPQWGLVFKSNLVEISPESCIIGSSRA